MIKQKKFEAGKSVGVEEELLEEIISRLKKTFIDFSIEKDNLHHGHGKILASIMTAGSLNFAAITVKAFLDGFPKKIRGKVKQDMIDIFMAQLEDKGTIDGH
jgi:hypothetical protein